MSNTLIWVLVFRIVAELFDPRGSGRLPPMNFPENAYVDFFTKICTGIEIL